MASAETAVIAALKADGGLAALVGTRVSIKGAVQGATYPYVTIERITTPTATSLDSPSNLDWPLLQIDAWDPVGQTSSDVADAIDAALDGKELTAGGLTFSASRQDRRGPSADEETRNFRTSLDFNIWHGRN